VEDAALVGARDQALQAPEGDRREDLAHAPRERRAVFLARVIGRPEQDLVVAGDGRHGLAPVLLAVRHRAQRATGGIERHRPAIAQADLHVRQALVLVGRTEDDLRQAHAAVGGCGSDEVPLQAARGGEHGGAGDAGQWERSDEGAVRDAVQGHLPVAPHRVEVAHVLVDADGQRGTAGVSLGRALSQGHDGEALAARGAEERPGLARDEEQDPHDRRDDGDAAQHDRARGRAIDALQPGDAPVRGRDPLPDGRCLAHGALTPGPGRRDDRPSSREDTVGRQPGRVAT
jgi:hypothetical protein